MDINTWRGVATVLVAIAFFAVCWWAYSPKRRKRFEQAANLPFADEQQDVGKQPATTPREADGTDKPDNQQHTVGQSEDNKNVQR